MTNTTAGAGQSPGYQYHPDGAVPTGDAVFVFGSNLAGRHGAGAAKAAREQFGARYGVGAGPTGRTYAIPTKDGRGNADLKAPSQVLPLSVVAEHVSRFIDYARAHPELSFFVTRVGCGLSARPDSDVAPLFAGAPPNCSFATEWRSHLEPASRPAPARARPR
jgi:hypothetical protein